jgi:retron-type reverse transcriptase
MECAEDIAGILTGILTYKGHLPTGSPSSPILSYYAHVDMWEKVDTLAREAGCTLTVYMDDVTLSGVKVPDSLVWKIKQQIHQSGLQYHKEKFYAGKVREVTGVIICDRQLKLPNRQHKKIYELRQQLPRGIESEQQNTLLNQLQGCEAQANQIEKANKALAVSSPTD